MTEQEEFEFRARLEKESRNAAKPVNANNSYRDELRRRLREDELRRRLRESSWFDRNLAGVGAAMMGVYEGGKQLFGLGNEDTIRDLRIYAEEAPVGTIIGNAVAYAPLALIPGVNTIAGGAAMGAAIGAAQPKLKGESRLRNAVVGGLFGLAAPSAVRVGKTIKAMTVDPFTHAGRVRIAGGLMNQVAGDAQGAAQRMQSAQGATPGFVPTAGQAAGDAGIASLERVTRAVNPGAFDSVESVQRQALADAVRNIAKDDIARAAAADARSAAAKTFYDAAFDPANQQPMTPWIKGQVTQLLKRPSIKSGIKEAQRMALERGEKPSPMGSLQGLHDLKKSLDGKIGDAVSSGRGYEAKLLLKTQDKLLDVMEKQSPLYKQARQTHADMSRPVNQMDIGQKFAERLIPALYRDMDAPAQLNAQAYAKALTDQGDDIAKKVTGMKGARLETIMEPEQMQALRGVLSDLQLIKAAQNAGRDVGSDTVQKTAISHIAAQAGIPNWVQSFARLPGGWAKRIGDIVYGSSDDHVRTMMAELLQNPQEAAAAMQAAGVYPSMIGEILSRGAQGAALSATPVLINREF